MVTETRYTSTSFSIVFRKPDKRKPSSGCHSDHQLHCGDTHALVIALENREAGRTTGQFEEICGDSNGWLLIQETLRAVILEPSERGGTPGAIYISALVRIIGAGRKFSQERSCERDRAVASERYFTNQRRAC
jgi:hypothetical protein